MLGILFAYWCCEFSEKEVEILENGTVFTKQIQDKTILHNPTPIPAKANQILSFPIDANSVVIVVTPTSPDLKNKLHNIENIFEKGSIVADDKERHELNMMV